MNEVETDTAPTSTSDLSPEQLRWSTLTSREVTVAKALATGSTNREISKALEISIKTVDTHRCHVLKKLGCRNNVELARLALKLGIVDNP